MRWTRSVLILLEFFSDHALVTCQLLENVGQATTAERLVRGWRRVDRSPAPHPGRQSAVPTRSGGR